MPEMNPFPRVRRGMVQVATAAWITLLCVSPALAQDVPRVVSRDDAIVQATASGPRLGIARADTVAAFAQLVSAKAFQNPALNAEFTKAPPQYHFRFELPIDLPGIRGLRISSAQSARSAAALRYAYERASVALDADTTYTRALAARARSTLARKNSQDADALRKIAVARRDAGDASDLDVELATVFAGQAANGAATDSLTYLSILLDLQAVMGISDAAISIVPGDSLGPPPISGAPMMPLNPESLLPVLAAQRAAESARSALRLERRSIFAGFSVAAGFETHDPSGAEKGMLPVFGVIIPLPLLNRNQGPIATARANEMRAMAELQLARVQSKTEIARAERELAIALRKVELDQAVIASANKVAAMSLVAYREGAAPLATSLEAQRSARDALAQYIDDLAAAWIATAELRVLTMTIAGGPSLR